jgi:hypothetical protein
MRPERHRYCSRLTGSVIDGEDVVQDSLASAFLTLKTMERRLPCAPGCSASHTRALDPNPSYVMWLEWREGEISFIRDTRYGGYVLADADLALDKGAAH